MSIASKIKEIINDLPSNVSLVAVSKTYPADAIMEAYDAGQRIFGENRPQEMVAKASALPKDIEWHQIGHLQTNKVKYIAPFVSLIHSVDSSRLLDVINQQAAKNNRVIDILFEIHIAAEQSKQGWTPQELIDYIDSGALEQLPSIRIRGLMGMATYTDNTDQIAREFSSLKELFDRISDRFDVNFNTLSMGMSGDYRIAIDSGSTMVRIGTSIFGERNYNK